MKVTRVLIVGRKNTDLVQNAISNLRGYLNELRIDCCLESELMLNLVSRSGCGIELSGTDNYSAIDLLERVDLHDFADFDLIVSVGGDGCFLAAAQWALRFGAPIVGINCGRLGFLGDLLPEQLFSLKEVMADGTLAQRSVLNVGRRVAVTEGVGAGYCLGVLAILQVEVDDVPLCTYQADGLIISTATGSTGHALSCGGPILEPTSRQVILAPLASHKLSSRPLVITPEQKITIKMLGKQNGCVVVDGKRCIGGQREIKVEVAKEKLNILHPKGYNFFAILRSKLEWES